jgi:enediyne biosynthesis protein E4
LVLTFGLAQREKADIVEIRWPSGQVDRLTNVAAGQTIGVTEGKGISTSRAYGKNN